MQYKSFARIQLVLLIVAFGVAIFLLLSEKSTILAPDHNVIFVLDINKTMNTQDILSGTQKISRLAAAKSLISQTIQTTSWYLYGLVLFNGSVYYLVPPTFDTGTFLLYLYGVTTHMLPDTSRDFAALSGIFSSRIASSYFILSDVVSVPYSFPSSVSLISLWITDYDYGNSGLALPHNISALSVSQRMILYSVLAFLIIFALLL